MQYRKRALQVQIQEAMLDTSVIAITGARRSGKSTLIQQLIPSDTSYVSLDDSTILTLAKNDPQTLIEMYPPPLAIDEIQKAPELITAIKLYVDITQEPGSFMLTGSANLMTIPKLAESLSGRVELLTLHPFTQAEIKGLDSSFLNKLVTNDFRHNPDVLLTQDALVEIIVNGGYPQTIEKQPARRSAWFRSYINTLIQRDVKEVFDIDKAQEFKLLLKTIAILTSETCKIDSLASSAGLSRPTVIKYIASLEGLYLAKRIPAWYTNELKRLSKAPKIHLMDTGIVAHLRGLTAQKLLMDRTQLGSLLETLVATELIKLTSNSPEDFDLFHYRSLDGDEVDFILTTNDGKKVGIEVKAGATYHQKWTKPMQKLIDKNLIDHGFIIYTGVHTVPLPTKITLLPIGHLFY